MNKELIKTYKAEFDHWLNGGTLLYRHFDYIKQKFTAWEKCNMEFPWKTSGIYAPSCIIINDEYVEFRKALAEGKTVQYNFGNYGINRKDFPNEWKDLDQSIGILADRACPENYRIKPEEPKFKVGDWVRSEEYGVIQLTPKNVDRYNKYTDTHIKGSGVYAELWQPKKGDWCWFWDEILKNPMLLQFERFCSTGFYKYETNNKLNYQYCEPFLGQLPTNLQDIK